MNNEDAVTRFLNEYPEVKTSNQALSSAWNRLVATAQLATLSLKQAQSRTSECCTHLVAVQDSLEAGRSDLMGAHGISHENEAESDARELVLVG